MTQIESQTGSLTQHKATRTEVCKREETLFIQCFEACGTSIDCKNTCKRPQNCDQKESKPHMVAQNGQTDNSEE